MITNNKFIKNRDEMKKAILSAAVILTLWTSAMIPGSFADSDLTVKPDKNFVITYPDVPLPVEKTAAEELAKYIGQSIGIKTIILPESKLNKDDSADAYVGNCSYATKEEDCLKEFNPEGFQILVKNGKLFIRGDDEKGDPLSQAIRTGTLFGVYDFLENELGIAWIWPGKSGEDVPIHNELRLKPFSRTDSPKLSVRQLKGTFNQPAPKEETNLQSGAFVKRLKLSCISKTWFGHSWNRYMAGIGQQHPEWRALVNGERMEGASIQYCTSNKEFRDYIVGQCLNNPYNKGYSIVSISPADGAGFCQCENCRALDPKDTDYTTATAQQNLSNRYWDYANYVAREVKKSRPGLGVGMIAYSCYVDPPTNIDKFEDNLYVELCSSVAYSTKPESKKELYKLYEGWQQVGCKIKSYEYWGMHYWLGLPYVFTRQLKEDMPQLYKCGLMAMHGESQRNYATQGPVYYLVAHQMWNPNIDADKVMKRYYQAFGPASNYIREYFDIFENSIIENQDKIKAFKYNELINKWPEIFPEKTIVKAGAALQKAKDAVKDSPIYAERVQVIDFGYQYAKTTLEAIAIYRKLGRAGVPLWCFGRAGIIAEFEYWQKPGKSFVLNKMPVEWVSFIDEHPDQPIEKGEKIELLKQAWRLGNDRERIINESAAWPANIYGMYYHYVGKGIYAWHQTIKEEMEKEGIKAE